MIVAIVKIEAGVQPVIVFQPGATEAIAVADFCASYAPPLNANDYLGRDAAGLDLLLPWSYDFGAHHR